MVGAVRGLVGQLVAQFDLFRGSDGLVREGDGLMSGMETFVRDVAGAFREGDSVFLGIAGRFRGTAGAFREAGERKSGESICTE